MDKEELKDMIALLSGTGLLHDVPLSYKKDLVAAYTDRYAKKSDIVFVSDTFLGIRRGSDFPPESLPGLLLQYSGHARWSV